MQGLQLAHAQEIQNLKDHYEGELDYFEDWVVQLQDFGKSSERQVVELKGQVEELEQANRMDMQESLRLHRRIRTLEKRLKRDEEGEE